MNLTIHRGIQTEKKLATLENVARAVVEVYSQENDDIILADSEINTFIQTAAGGEHIEYQENLIHYFVEGIPQEKASELFLSFYKKEDAWRLSVNWIVDHSLSEGLQVHENDNDIKNNEQIIDSEENFSLNTYSPWSLERLREWQQQITDGQNRLAAHPRIIRLEWGSILWPINERKYYQLSLEEALFLEYEKSCLDARQVAFEMEYLYWKQKLQQLQEETIVSVSVKRRMLYEATEARDFLSDHPDVFDKLSPSLRLVKERLAWFRARKRLDEADVAEAGGRIIKSEKLRREAAVLLKQDWAEVFPGEKPPS